MQIVGTGPNAAAAGGIASRRWHATCALSDSLGMGAGGGGRPTISPQLFPIPHPGHNLLRQREPQLMREHGNLPAMVGFVSNHIAQHLGADRPGLSPAVSQESRDAATAAERFSQHFRTANGALGQSGTGLLRCAVGAVQLRWNLQMRHRSLTHLQRTLCMWVKMAAMVRTFPGGLAFQAAGSSCSIRSWLMRSLTAKIRTAASAG